MEPFWPDEHYQKKIFLIASSSSTVFAIKTTWACKEQSAATLAEQTHATRRI